MSFTFLKHLQFCCSIVEFAFNSGVCQQKKLTEIKNKLKFERKKNKYAQIMFVCE